MKLLRTTPPERVIPKGKLKETFVTAMGKISAGPIFHGFIRSGPDATSMVMAMKMMVMMALAMMPIMAMRTFPRRSGDDGPPPSGGDESTDWAAGDEDDDDDDPELPSTARRRWPAAERRR